MNEALEQARELQARMYADLTTAKDRGEYIRMYANYCDVQRLVAVLEGLDNQPRTV